MNAVLIIDQDPREEALYGIISQIPDIEIVMRSDSVDDALKLCEMHAAEIVIMDILSGDEEIPGYVARIKQAFFNMKVCVLLCDKDANLAYKVKEAGADIVAKGNITLDEWRQLIQYAKKHYRVYPNSNGQPKEPR
ncbi:MAG: response regulator transcription factor [Clostridia bacterium]|nr:response regulator transcription factor [Clostridia bacterium]